MAAAGGGQSLTNHAERAAILAAPSGQVGRGLDAYRARPILVASHQPLVLRNLSMLRR